MLWTRARYAVRHRTSQVVVVLVLTVGSVALLLAAFHARDGFLGDLYLNVGAGLAITLSTYVVLNPLFKELRAVRITEHPRLDREGLIEHFAQGRESVSMLETWSDMFELPYRDRFLEALRRALENNATVRILLLDPDSRGAGLRTEELHHKRDVQLAIMANLRHLAALRETLSEERQRRLRVRIYDASPSVQMYRWDDKAYISFFPLDQSNFNSPQIETYMSTPLGEFVQRRFDELWSAKTTRDLSHMITLRIRARYGDHDLEPCDVRFVELDGIHFVTGATLVRQVSRYGIGRLSAVLGDGPDSGEPTPTFVMEEADDLEPQHYRRVLSLFAAKYGIDTRHDEEQPLIISLRPIEDAAAAALEHPTIAGTP